MDTELIEALRNTVQPAVHALIALADERGVSALEICQNGMRIAVERRPGLRATAAATAPEDESSALAAEDEVNRHLTPVLSTLVGTFKTRTAADAQPAAVVGGTVAAGQVLGWIESMRLSYEVHAPSAGSVAEILVEDGHPVEYGQPLIVLEAMGPDILKVETQV